MNAEQLDLCRTFADGAVSAAKFNRPPEMFFAECWYPTVAGKHVRNSDAPEHGYDTRAEALAAATKYRERCRAALKAGDRKDG